MIIFGTRGVTTNAGQGTFHCPSCGSPQHYHQRRVRRFFTLYFIPLIPLEKLGEFVECDGCKGSFKPEVLEFDPEAGTARFEAEFHRAIRRVMVLMMLADGEVDEDEIATIRDIYRQLTSEEIGDAGVRSEIEQARADGKEVDDVLSEFAGSLNSNGKELVVRAAYLVAAADGKFDDSEKASLLAIGNALQMTPAHLRGVIASMTEAAD